MTARYSFLIPIIVGCAQFMHQFDGAVIATALPSMARSLNEDPLHLNLAITCYLLALAVFVPVSGWLADKYGAKQIYLIAIFIFTASSVLCGWASSLPQLVVSRILQGMGGAMMTPVGRLIVVRTAPKSDLVKAMNYITIPGALAPLLGPSVGGFIVTYFSWPWIFFVNLPIGIIGLLLVYTHIPALEKGPLRPFDLLGFCLTSISLASLVFGFEIMGRSILPPSYVATLLIGGSLMAGFYIYHAQRVDNPIIDLKLLRIRSFAASITGGGLFYIGTTSFVFLIALVLQLGFGFSAFHAGLTTLAGAAGSLTTRFVFPHVLRFFGFQHLLISNAILMGVYLIMCGFFDPSMPFPLMLVLLFIGGYARSTQFTAVQSLAYVDMPSEHMSSATSFSAMSQQLAQSFGVGLAALIIHISLSWHGSATLSLTDMMPSFFTLGAAVIFSALIFKGLPAQTGAEFGTARNPQERKNK
jgi:EmrB/QacA subfamily drug resistance transporter